MKWASTITLVEVWARDIALILLAYLPTLSIYDASGLSAWLSRISMGGTYFPLYRSAYLWALLAGSLILIPILLRVFVRSPLLGFISFLPAALTINIAAIFAMALRSDRWLDFYSEISESPIKELIHLSLYSLGPLAGWLYFGVYFAVVWMLRIFALRLERRIEIQLDSRPRALLS